MKLTNKTNLPQPIYDAIANDPYDRGEADISITGLLKPPRQLSLEQYHEADLEEDASDRVYSLLGQLMHLLLERANKSATVEKRLYMPIAGWKISGQMDRIVFEDGLLQDFKFVTVYKVRDGLDPEFEKQQNMYAALLRANGKDVKKIQIVAILRDWSKMEAARNPDYPQQQIVVQDVPIWDADKANKFIEERVLAHKAARKRLPLCTAEERWARPAKWAVMKKGQKKALRLYDDKAAADQHVKIVAGGYVEERPGANVRCENYCAVSKFCKQFKKLQQKTNEEKL